MPRFVMLNTLDIWASYNSPTRSLIENRFPNDIEKFFVPGPSIMPTPQLPKRPMLLSGLTNAAGLSHWSRVGFDTKGSTPATQSGRMKPPALRNPGLVPDGSVPVNVGVRNGPDCSRTIPVTFYPPTRRSTAGPTLWKKLGPRPQANSKKNVLT